MLSLFHRENQLLLSNHGTLKQIFRQPHSLPFLEESQTINLTDDLLKDSEGTMSIKTWCSIAGCSFSSPTRQMVPWFSQGVAPRSFTSALQGFLFYLYSYGIYGSDAFFS